MWACIAVIEAPFLIAGAAGALCLVLILLWGLTIGVVVDTAILCLALLMLVVVPELGPLAMILAVSTENSPPGSFRVLQISPGREIGEEDTLMHSTTYAYPTALEAIAKLVAERSDLQFT